MYNIRVYGLLIENNAVLVSDEYYKEIYMTKFPGGGHEIGESLIDCLKREFIEELNLEINILSHFYTTDFFVPSFFNSNHQLISIYYLVQRKNTNSIAISTKKFDFKPLHGAQSLRWIQLKDMNDDDFTYPIDKKVAILLKNSFNLY
ncbi:MAG TPA: NUDIX domain-containing protein [Bacteroidia bacterium]|nr:NUDIX domain-containing protein [Bacteroidia bacterium]